MAYARVMLPDDANPAGNVHGGTILRMIEHAGYIVAMRHCNSGRGVADADSGEGEVLAAVRPPTWAALARLETMQFLAPMHIGEVAQIEAEVTFVARRSLEVTARVWAESPVRPDGRRLTNVARLWYVGVLGGARGSGGDGDGGCFPPTDVPRLQAQGERDEAAGRQRYEQPTGAGASEGEGAEGGTVAASATELVQLVLPSDCTSSGIAFGGFVMKLADNAAGIAAVRHCRTNVVTANIEAMNFVFPISNGDLVRVSARVDFTSGRSLEVGVHVEAEKLHSGTRHVCCRARLTFVSLGADGAVQAVPALRWEGPVQRVRFQRGQQRYEQRKLERQRRKKK
eukprot:g3525.t1